MEDDFRDVNVLVTKEYTSKLDKYLHRNYSERNRSFCQALHRFIYVISTQNKKHDLSYTNVIAQTENSTKVISLSRKDVLCDLSDL